MSTLDVLASRIPTENQPWYQNMLTENQLKVIKQQQVVEQQQLAFKQKQWNEVLSMFKDAFGSITGNTGVTVPSEFAQVANLFQPGGQYGAGAKAEVAKSANQALATGQIGLAQTGMSSGTNAAGLAARIGSDVGLANAKIEDERVNLLSNALNQMGQANLTAQQLKTQRDALIMNTLGSIG
jgi:hypothetical protein